MWRGLIPIVLLTGGGPMLTGCGRSASRSPAPAFIRAQARDPPPPEAPPDVKQLVREKLDSVFVAASNPRQVQVSPPRHDLRGLGWTACVKAELTNAVGKPLGSETFRSMIKSGVIID